MDSYISGEVPFPEGGEAKALHKNNLFKAKRIISDSIKDHVIPQMSSLNMPKEMFNSLTKLFEGKNINWNMTLRNKVEECEDPECRDHIVIRVSQIKEQIEAVKEEVKNAEVVIAILKSILGSWN